MKCSRNCGLSITVSSMVAVITEILVCGVSMAFCCYMWLAQKELNFLFIFTRGADPYKVANSKFTACVTNWILMLIVVISVMRILMALMLAFAIKKNSASMSRAWIGFKILALCLASFLGIASMTVGTPVKILAWSDFVAQLVTCYFVAILIPQLDIMVRSVVFHVKESLEK